MTDLLAAVALVLVIEGIVPFLSPHSMRRWLFYVVQQNDKTLRITGFVAMLIGVVLLYAVRH